MWKSNCKARVKAENLSYADKKVKHNVTNSGNY